MNHDDKMIGRRAFRRRRLTGISSTIDRFLRLDTASIVAHLSPRLLRQYVEPIHLRRVPLPSPPPRRKRPKRREREEEERQLRNRSTATSQARSAGWVRTEEEGDAPLETNKRRRTTRNPRGRGGPASEGR